MKRILKKSLLGLGVIALPLLIYVGCKTSRAGYESAAYTPTLKEGDYEIREYPDLAVVIAPMKVAGRNGMNSGFNQLFRYITGNNESETKIAMTTPVFIDPAGEDSTMSFVLPNEMNALAAPQPNSQAVSVATKKAGTFAAYRFSGSQNPESERDAVEKLKAWITKQGLNASSDPEFAYYDPPWTPSFLRRNEVLIRIGESRQVPES